MPGKAKAQYCVVQGRQGAVRPPIFAREHISVSLGNLTSILPYLKQRHCSAAAPLLDDNLLTNQIRQFWRGKHRIKSKMEIDPATQGDAGIYECHANNK